ARKAFVARVRKHIDDVAAKYILPDEGTYDFALMYVPAENVYYEAIVRDDGAGSERSLGAYALERKVMPVSPNSFYGYLQAIVLGLRGLRIEARAQEVIGQLARLAGDLGRLQEDFRVLGRHVTNAAQAHAAADRRLDRLTVKLAEIRKKIGELVDYYHQCSEVGNLPAIPGAVLLVSDRRLEFTPTSSHRVLGVLQIPGDEGVLRALDGQHRLLALHQMITAGE